MPDATLEVTYRRHVGSGHQDRKSWHRVPPAPLSGDQHPSDEELEAIGKVLEENWASLAIAVTLAHLPSGVYVHSQTQPALITDYGAKYWLQHGKRFRDDDLPALEDPSGLLRWYGRDGQLHRTTGPASMREDGGGRGWWLRGEVLGQTMFALEADLARGGRLPKLTRTNQFGVRVATANLDGSSPKTFVIPCQGWVDWMLANRDRCYPELAAAFRAKAMSDVLSAAHGGSARAAAPARPETNRRPARPASV